MIEVRYTEPGGWRSFYTASKIVFLLEDVTKKFSRAEVTTETHLNKLERFCVFAVSVYVPCLLVSPFTINVHINNLILANKL